MRDLINMYKEIGHNLYQSFSNFYLKELSQQYDSIREVRGDGCCFYRALLCSQLERILREGDERIRFILLISSFHSYCFYSIFYECYIFSLLNIQLRFSNLCKGWRKRLLKQNFPAFTTNDFCDVFDELLNDISDGKIDATLLLSMLNEDARSNYYVTFLRLVTSGYLRENSDLYAGFIEGDRSVEQYCRDEIEPSFTECDHIGISALSNALGISIRVEYIDCSSVPGGSSFHDFLCDSTEPQLFFLYRPGHYDILYKKFS
ncbi:unnamed protein product [Dracunculus medinensis]|uniref:ubiquitinyl hydrolase 1 n=1 Tax=Dracunculus medinensis TaxID=318479 RepID=A0A0N4U0V4_DRAME|nr:unnamed protein product [Dracunculus medinensis]